MKSFLKQIIAVLVLASFVSVVFLSFNTIMQGPDGRMVGDCPFSAMGASLCPQDTVAVAAHHISAYYAFLNIPIGSNVVSLIISLLAVAGTILAIFKYSPLLGPPQFLRVFHNSPPPDSNKRKIIHWLSLFENSPSFT